jgi:hypothetical protein
MEDLTPFFRFDLLGDSVSSVIPRLGTHRRKIRLIEGKTKWRHLKNYPVKELVAGVYLSEAQNPYPLPLTHYILVYSILIHTGGGELNQREGERNNSSQSW